MSARNEIPFTEYEKALLEAALIVCDSKRVHDIVIAAGWVGVVEVPGDIEDLLGKLKDWSIA